MDIFKKPQSYIGGRSYAIKPGYKIGLLGVDFGELPSKILLNSEQERFGGTKLFISDTYRERLKIGRHN